MSIVIRRVERAEELRAVFRLRYEVYIDELGRAQRYADHAARCIEEPLDRRALIYGAFEGARCIGTVRINHSRDGALGEYEALYAMSHVGSAHPAHTAITTKLLVCADKRNTTLAFRLALAAYVDGMHAGIRHDFIDVYPARVPFFERLGYRVHVPEVEHSEFGRVMVMRLDMHDVEHMRRVRSPLLPYALRALRALRSAEAPVSPARTHAADTEEIR